MAVEFLYESDNKFQINREALFQGSGMLNTFIKIAKQCYFTDHGSTSSYTGKRIIPKTGEFEGNIYSFDFLRECNGSKKGQSVINSIKKLKDNSFIRITYKYNNVDKNHFKENHQALRFIISDDYKDQLFAKYIKHNPHKPAATKGGYFFIPRNLSCYLPENYVFDKTDAIWDILTSVCYNDKGFPNSIGQAIAVFTDKAGNPKATYTYEELRERWNWKSKSTVSDFLIKCNELFEVKKNKRKSQIIIKDSVLNSGLFWKIKKEVEVDKSGKNDMVKLIEKTGTFNEGRIKIKPLFYSLCDLTDEYQEFKKERAKLEALTPEEIEIENEKSYILYEESRE